ncbi:MAG: universal stress protein [Ferrovibrio sp.]|uniref:universal stress protein n=1 Tax=Ferrovibrio sp. TaxID=1917215 RepID=UPI00391A0E3C
MMALQLLVPVITYQAGNADKLIDNVTGIAKYLAADVHALVHVPDFPPVASALGNMMLDVPSMVRDVKTDCRARARVLVEVIGQALAGQKLQFRTTEVVCFPPEFGDVTAVHARYHDLVVVDLDTSASAPGAAEAIIFGSGKPTLLVSDKVEKIDFGHVMIAWDGTRAASRAVTDAAHFLQRATKVTVATVTEEKQLPSDDPNARLVDYLSRWGIPAQTINVGGGRFNPVAKLLQDKARELGAGLLVMGGFGHSRVRDFVLGGATNGILKDLQVPALLSH